MTYVTLPAEGLFLKSFKLDQYTTFYTFISDKRKAEYIPKIMTKKECLQHTVRTQDELPWAKNEILLTKITIKKIKIEYHRELLALKERSTKAK